MEKPVITVNGRPMSLEGVDPNTTLLWFLRDRGLTGSKEGCAEGECGACAVALVRSDGNGGSRLDGINACLVLTAALAGQEIVTVEGIADGKQLHAVQEAMIREGGSQCGYCTPGFVVSLFAEHYRRGKTGYDGEAIAGNLCRCTGYRPIRDAARSLPLVPPKDRFTERLERPAPDMRSYAHEVGERRLFRPAGLGELLDVLAREPGAKIIAGGTDVVVEVNQRDLRLDLVVSLDGVEELHEWTENDEALVIGAGVPLAHVEERLHGRLPFFDQLLPLFSSRLIRNRATLGGNLVNASPIGDGPPVLLALDAEVVIASVDGERRVPVSQFFTGYRKTVLVAGEVVRSVRLPKPFAREQRFYKVSKRALDDISTVAAAFALDLASDGTVVRARLAYGGVAATPVRATEAERVLEGQPWTRATVSKACAVLRKTVAPIDDHRGSAAYRRAMVERLLEKLFADVEQEAAA